MINRILSFWWHPSHPSFDSLSIGGMLTLTHLFVSIILAGSGWFLYRYLRHLSPTYRQRHFQWIALALIVLEVIRMLWNILAADGWYPNDVWPLFTCGIFVIIFPFYAFNTRLKSFMVGFISLGAMMSGLLFLAFPSTGLGMFPLWHINTIISTTMHWLMAIIGALFFFDRTLRLKPYDIFSSFVIISIFASVSWLYNSLDGSTNFFFIAHPLAATPLVLIEQWFGVSFYGWIIYGFHLIVGYVMYMLHQSWIAVLPQKKEVTR